MMPRAKPLTFLAALVVAVMLLAPLGSSAAVQRSSQTSQADVDAMMFQLISTVMQAMSLDWGTWLQNEWGMPIPAAYYFLVGQDDRYQSACGDKPVYTYDYNNAEYCYYNQARDGTNNGMIIIPIGSMVRMIQGDIFGRPMEGEGFPGMYATVAITAHEFAHFLTFEILEWFTLQGVDIWLAAPPNVELLADCIAGEFMDTFNGGSDVDFSPTDVQNMVTALGLIADPSPNSGTHGTADQRGLAFLRGYTAQLDPYGAPAPPANQSSDAGKRLCFDTYWP